jgi:hypothetical protein
MDVVCPLVRRLCLAAALLTASSLACAADAPTAETPLQLQQRRLEALRLMADAASPSNVPDRETLVKGMIVVMAIADPALLPDGSAGIAALDDLRRLCANSAHAGVQLVRLAQATGDAEGMLARMSVAVDRTAIMTTACSARQLDIQGRAILARPGKRPTTAEVTAMREVAATLPGSIAGIILGATLTDLNPNSRARTASDGLPVLVEAAAAMPPATKAATLEAVRQKLAQPDSDGHIDHTARDPLLEPLRGSDCAASCTLLGAAEGDAR